MNRQLVGALALWFCLGIAAWAVVGEQGCPFNANAWSSGGVYVAR